jgi:hypothetical protein
MFSSRLKQAKIQPLFNKGDKNNTVNYNPVSLLTSFSKVTGKVIYVRLYQHLYANNILVNEKFGFKKNLSTVSHL